MATIKPTLTFETKGDAKKLVRHLREHGFTEHAEAVEKAARRHFAGRLCTYHFYLDKNYRHLTYRYTTTSDYDGRFRYIIYEKEKVRCGGFDLWKTNVLADVDGIKTRREAKATAIRELREIIEERKQEKVHANN